MSRPAVLAVDDRAENLLALEAVLAPLDARIVTAGSGEAALRALLSDDFAAILLDVQMPGMDGFETAGLIRGRERSAHTPIIFLTALSQDLENIARGYEAGAVDYVLKPFDPLVLRSKVGVFCDLARQRTARERADSLLRAAWDNAPTGMALVGPDGLVMQANPALQRLTGRGGTDLCGRLDEVVVPGDRAALAELREAVTDGRQEDGTVDVQVVDLAGAAIPVSVLVSAVPGDEGGQRSVLLQVSDLRERLLAREAQATLLAEQAARAEAEALAARLAAVAAITEGLEDHTTVALTAVLGSRLARVLRLDGVVVVVLAEEGRVAARHAEGVAPDETGLEALLAGGPPGPPADGTTIVPMRVDGRLVGAVAVVGLRTADPQHARSSALLRHAVERAAFIIERARLHERERMIAATLQRDLLPETLPTVPGVAVSAHFSSGGDGVRVGGDWYDALALPGGRLGVVVGDVAGRGVAAAARMGEQRSVARAYALEGHSPAEVLRRMNAYHLAMGTDSMTTLLYAVIEPDRDRARFASAGHMPPLLVPAPEPDPSRHDAQPHFLDAIGPPLGVLEVGNFEEREVALPPGAMLTLYTDGLVERRGEVLDVGLERLRQAVSGARAVDVGDLREQTLAACVDGEVDDDVTVVFVRAQELLGPSANYTLTPDPEALAALRRHLRRWLEEAGAHPGEATEITMAVNEAMQNAIEHGNAYAIAPITVSLDLRGDDVVVCVRDLGHDGTRSPDPDRGRGIQLMNALMDDARVDLGGPMGGAVTLRRRLRAPAARLP